MAVHLVTITSANENNFIKHLILYGNKGSYWIGGYKNNFGVWQWVTNEPFSFTQWAQGEPNNGFNGRENKIMLLFKILDPKNPNAKFAEWNDIIPNCGEGEYPSNVYGVAAFGLICEWESSNSFKVNY